MKKKKNKTRSKRKRKIKDVAGDIKRKSVCKWNVKDKDVRKFGFFFFFYKKTITFKIIIILK